MQKNLLLAGASLLLLFPFGVSTKTPAAANPGNEDIAATVRKKLEAIQPADTVTPFDQIGWAASIVQAEQMARQHHRPVFLFTEDGKIDTGHC